MEGELIIMNKWDNSFDREFRSMKKSAVGLGFLGIAFSLVFWLGMLAGGLFLLRYFGII